MASLHLRQRVSELPIIQCEPNSVHSIVPKQMDVPTMEAIADILARDLLLTVLGLCESGETRTNLRLCRLIESIPFVY